jgi:hypothetical protein
MGNGKKIANGCFQLVFKSEKQFNAFGRSYAAVYANFTIKGQFDKPVATGPLTYSITFQAVCGCDSILRSFNFAYDKTFKDKNLNPLILTPLAFNDSADEISTTRAQLDLDTDDYTASLSTCGINTQLADRRTEFTSADKTSLKLTAIDQQMVFADATIGQDAVNAFSYLNLFAQAATRAKLKSEGYDPSDPNLYKSWTWFGELQNQLQALGCTVDSLTDNEVKQNTYSGEVNIGEIMKSIMSIYLSAESAGQFAALGDLLAKDPDDTSITNFMNFWWSYSSVSTTSSGFAMGPLEMFNGNPTITLVFFHYDVKFTDWRSLFVSFHSEAVDIGSTAIKLSFNMDQYNAQSAALLLKLQGQIANNIANTTLTF